MFREPAPLSSVIVTYVVMGGIATIVQFFLLTAILHLLRRPMDLTFPEPWRFYQRVLLMAAVTGGLGLIPCAGGLLALIAVAGLTMKFFDGGVLAGGYVALAMLAAHYALYYTVMVSLMRR